MIPEKNKPYFEILLQKKDYDNTLIEGNLTCCNSHDFEVFVVGEIKHSLFSKMLLFPLDNNVIFEVRCKKCGKVISVFDSRCDGYENCELAPPPPLPTNQIYCKKCGHNFWGVRLRYEYPNIQELEELNINQIDNAFTWVWGTIECKNCGTVYKNFINYETA